MVDQLGRVSVGIEPTCGVFAFMIMGDIFIL